MTDGRLVLTHQADMSMRRRLSADLVPMTPALSLEGIREWRKVLRQVCVAKSHGALLRKDGAEHGQLAPPGAFRLHDAGLQVI